MSSVAAGLPARPVLTDLLPRTVVRDVAVVMAGVLLVAASAQIVVPLPFTPVPISGSTFGVLLVGAALGPLRGVLAMGLYLALGLVGLPFYAEASGGVDYLAGATGGYIVAYPVVALLVGACARRGLDRTPRGMAVAFLLGSAVFYAIGVPWLAAATGMNAGEALRAGMLPFLVGDLAKAALAAGLLPGVWRLLDRRA